MRTLADIVTVVAACAAVGIVGTVERGGSISLMLWTMPLIAVAVLAERWSRKKYKNSSK